MLVFCGGTREPNRAGEEPQGDPTAAACSWGVPGHQYNGFTDRQEAQGMKVSFNPQQSETQCPGDLGVGGPHRSQPRAAGKGSKCWSRPEHHK